MGKKKRQIPWARILRQHHIGIEEASAVARLPDGVFLVVDDERGVFRYALDAGVTIEPNAKELVDGEGICLSPDGSSVFTLSERDGSVWHHRIETGALGPGRRLGALPRVGKRRNQGWEGIAYAEANLLGPSPLLIAVHQRRPRAIGLFEPQSLAPKGMFSLPRSTKKRLGDLNDIAIHPHRGDLLVVSGKQGLLAELTLDDTELREKRLFRIDHHRNDVPEGLAYDADGRLWLVTDGRGHLRELDLEN
ncbi:MAG: SdiA-regulated domain-containing protein [Myxococcota bacterium]